MTAPSQAPYESGKSLTVVHTTSAPPRLRVAVEDVHVQEYAAVPTLRFAVRVESAGGEPIRALVLDTQINVAAARRSYNAEEKKRLVELFGPPPMWGTSLRSLLWTRTTVYAPSFTDSTRVDIPVACTYDFEVTVVKYFHALEENAIPLEFLFTGSMFYTGQDGHLQTARIPWDTEADFRLPVQLWRTAMERHFSDSAWLRLRSDTLSQLYAYKARSTLASLDDAVQALLSDAEHKEWDDTDGEDREDGQDGEEDERQEAHDWRGPDGSRGRRAPGRTVPGDPPGN